MNTPSTVTFTVATSLKARKLGLVEELGSLLPKGDKVVIINHNDRPVGYLHQDEMGTLDAIEIVEAERRQGIASVALLTFFDSKPFEAYVTTDAGRSLMESLSGVPFDGNFGTVTPRRGVVRRIVPAASFATEVESDAVAA